MTNEKLAELIEINLLFAKSELRQMTDASALVRALLHIEKALKELSTVKRQTAKKSDRKAKAC